MLGHEVFMLDVLRVQQPEQCVSEQPRVVPVVEAPFQLVEVGVQVLDADLVVGPDDGPLQEAPDVLR